MSKIQALVEFLSNKPILTRKDLATRYGRDLRSIDRWHHNGTLPAAKYLRGCALPFWRACDLEAAEQTKRTLKRARGDNGKK